MAADISFGKLNTSEDDIKEVLRQAFVSVENGYAEAIDDLLARKTILQCEIPDGLSQYEISQKYQHILDELNTINEELSIGASAVLALIYKEKLYIGNVGNCRALLIKNDMNYVLRVIQLTVDHNLNNDDEILRLCQLGLDIQSLRQAPFYSTRCIGNHLGKKGYKDCDFLSCANGEPVISQPEIVGPIKIDDSCR
jgi:TAK1-binding protein 1